MAGQSSTRTASQPRYDHALRGRARSLEKAAAAAGRAHSTLTRPPNQSPPCSSSPSSACNPLKQTSLPMSLLPGSELTSDLYRWDQRVFHFVMAAQPKKPADATSLAWLADATCGTTVLPKSAAQAGTGRLVRPRRCPTHRHALLGLVFCPSSPGLTRLAPAPPLPCPAPALLWSSSGPFSSGLSRALPGATTVVTSLKALMTAMDVTLGLAPAPAPQGGPAPVHQAGVFVDWEEAPADPALPPTPTAVYGRLVHVRPNNARGTVTVHWPLLEPSWLDGLTTTLVRTHVPIDTHRFTGCLTYFGHR